ncbi:elongation of very long chain fatty acids protein 2-like [Ruditapes philippinarum]|uniref:elongation of very long chain fatty acids protein 2-like n=1 Tax=Ruditapes philippinarum TaxID=129788 RepID=UPI00295A9D97|nr:elongation of very long chain fatty acids protein 2-like [Ruditapes philippinarum]XP_060593281.1 elongation of very long chain fatty acids protein 2-like [Ruditapes philippinarum]XP_060593288.1 elongation of very long chain fatty acids protein 2-like [Ruditapes philippinarum]XP_060593297.1 elongation of very long chain fatty acids protein 2-like [Ruditapes philippinarum]
MGIPIISHYLDEIEDAVTKYGDPRTRYWFMFFGNPIPVWLLTIAYLVFVVYAGPKFMKNRKPYSLQTFMVVYNLGLVIMSIYMFAEFLLSTRAAGYNWLCSPYTENTWKDPREMRVANVMWYYAISKAIELLDTVLMILRKKDAQITFLHVFHHATMLNIWWWVPTFTPGGQTWFGSCLNCLVHVVMYSYYGLAVIPSLRDKLWWKKYITTFQLIQFVVTFSHTMQTYFTGCDFPMWGQYLLGGYMVVMLILFGNFYIQSYIVKKNRRNQLKKTEAANGHKTNSVSENGSHSNKSKVDRKQVDDNVTNGNYLMNGHSNGVIKRQ